MGEAAIGSVRAMAVEDWLEAFAVGA